MAAASSEGNQTVTLAPLGGLTPQTLTISGVIADMTGSHDASGLTGAGNVMVDGGGTVWLKADNTYTGVSTIKGGTTFELTNSDGAGTGTIAFAATGTLQLDNATMPTNTISAFGVGDVLDLRGLTFHTGATAVLNSGTLTVTSNAVNKLLTLSNPAQTSFVAYTDGFGGTDVSFNAPSSPPALSNVATTASYTEEGSAVTLSTAVTVTDSNSTTLANATVSISGGVFAGDGDVLATSTAGTSITASYNSSTETLTLTGSDTLADYQTVLDRVTFSAAENPTDYGSHATRTVTWVLNDGGASNNLSTAATTTVSIVNVNDGPTLSNVATSAAWTEEGATTTLSSAVSVADPDNLDLAGATVSITGGTFASDGDVLTATTTGTSITASYNSSTETLALSGSDTLAHYQQVLDAVTFRAGENPTDFGSNATRTVTWVLNDGSASFNLSTAATTTVSIANVNDAPTLGNVATSAAWTEEGAATTLSSAVSVTDPDNLNLTGATVSITGGTFAGDADVLATTTTGTSITASYNSSTETLTLSGSDTLAHYGQVLDAVTFHAGENPADYGSNPTRAITWVLNDGSGSNNLSTAVTSTVSITNVNDAPTLSGVASSAFYNDGGPGVTVSSSVTVSDPDNLNLTGATVHVSAGTFAGDGDVLATTTAGTSITASYNSATETLTLTGTDTLADYQTVLDAVTFSSSNLNPTDFGSNPTRTLTWVLNDGGASKNLSAAQTSTVSITNVNHPPTLGGIGNTVQFTPNGVAVTIDGALTTSDPDSLNLAGATVHVSAGTFAGDGDVLAATTTGTSITASYNSSTETLTLSGSDTLAHYQQVLDSVTFGSSNPNVDNGSLNPTRTVDWVLNDGAGSNNLSTTGHSTIGIAPAGPVITRIAATGTVDQDIVSGIGEAGTTVTLFDGGNPVGATATVDGTGHWSVTTGVLTVGQHNFTASASDAGGTTALSTALDIGVFSNARSQYTVTDTVSSNQRQWHVVDNGPGTDPTTNLTAPGAGIQYLQFSDHLFNVVNNANYDGSIYGDLLLQNQSNGQVIFAAMQNGSFLNWGAAAGSLGSLFVGGIGDVNGDGIADVFVQDPGGLPGSSSGGTVYVAEQHNTGTPTFITPVNGLNSTWKLVGAGDINGDLYTDFVIQQQTTGTIVYGSMVNGVFGGFGSVGSPQGFNVVGVGDVNGDGYADIVVQNHSTGEIDVANMQGGVFHNWIGVGSPQGYNVVAVADVTGDGYADIVVQNPTTGQSAIADMHNGVFTQWLPALSGANPDLKILAAADVNADGQKELLLQQQSTGTLYYANEGAAGFGNYGLVAAGPGLNAYKIVDPPVDTGVSTPSGAGAGAGGTPTASGASLALLNQFAAAGFGTEAAPGFGAGSPIGPDLGGLASDGSPILTKPGALSGQHA